MMVPRSLVNIGRQCRRQQQQQQQQKHAAATHVPAHSSPPTSSSKRPRAMTSPEMTSTMTTITDRRPIPITGSGIGVAADALNGSPASSAGAAWPKAEAGDGPVVARTALGTNPGLVPRKSTTAVKHRSAAEMRDDELRAMLRNAW